MDPMGCCGRLLVVATTQQTIDIYIYIKNNMYCIYVYILYILYLKALRFKNNFNRNTMFWNN